MLQVMGGHFERNAGPWSLVGLRLDRHFFSFPRMEAMLILTRKAGEQLRIGDQIVVTVQRVDRNSVRIGIEAPGEVPIVRGELLAEISDAALSAEVG
jgi:carbon storage regulator